MNEIREGLRSLDRRVTFALIYTAVVLSATEFWFLPNVNYKLRIAAALPSVPSDLVAGLTWVASMLVFFLLIPAAITRCFHREPTAGIGWRTTGFLRHLAVYAVLFAVMTPLIYLASQRPEFIERYPFVETARHRFGVFLIWETAYVAQFLALESFFRGYLLFTLERRFGWNAVPVMVVPYVMIHFHKPPAECMGAVAAGCILGVLALRFRSFLGGVVLHAAVAVTMDVLAVRRSGLF